MTVLDLLVINTGTVHTCAGAFPRRGTQMLDTAPVKGAVVACVGEEIAYIGPQEGLERAGLCIGSDTLVLDANGGDVVPGFVDSHAHVIWLGDRRPEFAEMLRGVSYAEITARGGGINTTVRATRDAPVRDLVATGLDRLNRMLAFGSTTVESKSGYALTLEGELRMLEAGALLEQMTPQNLVHTFLGAHLIPSEYKNDRKGFVDLVVDQMLPAVVGQGIAQFCDVFMEFNAFNRAETERILRTAMAMGLKPRLHADELSDTGAAALAVELGAASCDHLEYISDESIRLLASSGTVATLMPGVSFYLNMESHAPFKRLYEAGCAIAVATDFNPGTSPSLSIQGAFAVAVLGMRMPVEAALIAITSNAAYSLGIHDRVGSLEPGKRADIVVLKGTPVDMAYHWGENAAAAVICSGMLIPR